MQIKKLIIKAERELKEMFWVILALILMGVLLTAAEVFNYFLGPYNEEVDVMVTLLTTISGGLS